MIGICGVAMGTLAAMLQEKGHSVRGSDKDIYPPMSIRLSEWGIIVYKGFDKTRLTDVDLVIIGNSISRGNEEAEYILNKKLEYISMPEALWRFFLFDKEVIAICGTHGKTTTTALLAHIMQQAGEDPSYLVGGVIENYNSNYRLGKGKYFIIEGDEYDSAFFEKIPKFIRYRPHHLILTSLEFDHADIYNNLTEIVTWFKHLVKMVPTNGNIIYNSDYASLNQIITKSFSKNFNYGSSENEQFAYFFKEHKEQFSYLDISYKGKPYIELKTILIGEFNYLNICAATAMAYQLGVDIDKIQKAVLSFKGVKRRQQLIYSRPEIKIYEDFAHHPTAIKGMLEAVRQKYPDAYIHALYEPRSATSRRNIFQNELPDSFKGADNILIKTPFKLDKIPDAEQIDIEKVKADLLERGKTVLIFTNVDDMVKSLLDCLNKDILNVIVIMSNGGFDGIYEKILKRME